MPLKELTSEEKRHKSYFNVNQEIARECFIWKRKNREFKHCISPLIFKYVRANEFRKKMKLLLSDCYIQTF